MEQQFTGLIDDPRTTLEKLRDYKHEETVFSLAMGNPIIWEEKNKDKWKRYSTRNQDGSTSCVAQASAKALEVFLKNIYSATPIYNNRTNYPQKGMWLGDAGNILKKIGTKLESEVKSQLINDEQMEALGKTFDNTQKIFSYITINEKNFDGIVQQIANGNPVLLITHCRYDEYTDIPEYKGGPTELGHCICATDYTLYQGKKYIVIDESWGHGISMFDDKRLISEDFLKARIDGAMYFVITDNTPKPEKPNHTFNVNMVYGDKNEDVKWLQKVLVYEGFLKPIFTTGYFGDITFSAVRKWQEAHYHEILKPAGLKTASAKVLNFSRDYLNRVYSV